MPTKEEMKQSYPKDINSPPVIVDQVEQPPSDDLEKMRQSYRETVGATSQEDNNLNVLTEPPRQPEPQRQLTQEPFDYDFSWAKMAKNIIPSMVKNIEDLKHLPGALTALPQLGKELLHVGKLEDREGQFPLLNGIKDFYKENYNIFSAEGQQRFQKYVEEHPTQFLADMVGIVATIIAPGVGLAAKTSKGVALANKLNASNHLLAKGVTKAIKTGKDIASKRGLRGTARVLEVGLDPLSAGARLGENKLSNLFAKNKIKFEDKTSQTPSEQRWAGVQDLFGTDKAAQLFEFDHKIFNDAWKDGFKPDALKKHLKKVKPEEQITLPFDKSRTIYEFADVLARNTTPANFWRTIKRGSELVSKFPIGSALGMAGTATGGFTQWHYFIIGSSADFINWAFIPKDVGLPKWFYKEPHGWKAFTKKMAVTTGRGLQRGSRIMEEQQKELEKQRTLRRMRGGDLRQ